MIFSIKLKYFRLVLTVIVKTRQKLPMSISEVLRNCVILLVNKNVSCDKNVRKYYFSFVTDWNSYNNESVSRRFGVISYLSNVQEYRSSRLLSASSH